jgi:hypothetical protein
VAFDFDDNGFAIAPSPRAEVDDEKNVYVEWAFGPQGHPASMRVHLWSLAAGVELIRHGPLLTMRGEDGVGRWCNPVEIAPNLHRLLAFGLDIDARWGKDPFWWRCKEGCVGWQYTGEPPYQRCPDCTTLRVTTEQAVTDWLKQHR